MRNNLTILTVAAQENRSGLLPYTIESIKMFTRPRPRIIIVDNDHHNAASLLKYQKDPHITILDNRDYPEYKFDQSTSFRHGHGLNAGMKLVTTPYTAIIESDCVICSPNWHMFNRKKYDMVVARKGEKENEEYYHMFFMIFKTSLFKNIDWTPSMSRVDKHMQADTGCRVLDNLPNKNRILTLDTYRCRDGHTKIFNNPKFNYKCVELWNKNQDVIAAHFGRGSDLNRRKFSNDKENPDKQCQSWRRMIKRELGITIPRG